MGSAGFFVALEGVDGSGKSTQLQRLKARLEDDGHSVVTVREPGSTALGEAVRGVLLQRGEIPLTAEAELLLFLAARVQLHEEVVAPALAEGRVVLSDRYYLSSIVYQGIAGELGEARVVELCQDVLRDRRPHLHLILQIPWERGEERRDGPEDRFEGRPGFLRKVHSAYDRVSGLPGDTVRRIDGEGSPDEVTERLYEEIRRAL